MKNEDSKLIEIPLSLARLLLAQPKDYKDRQYYETTQALAKQMLNVIVLGNE